LRLFFI